jgi:hypothetical protein
VWIYSRIYRILIAISAWNALNRVQVSIEMVKFFKTIKAPPVSFAPAPPRDPPPHLLAGERVDVEGAEREPRAF